MARASDDRALGRTRSSGSQGSEIEKVEAFRAARALEHRVKLFMSLPIASLDKMSPRGTRRAIGRSSRHYRQLAAEGSWHPAADRDGGRFRA